MQQRVFCMFVSGPAAVIHHIIIWGKMEEKSVRYNFSFVHTFSKKHGKMFPVSFCLRESPDRQIAAKDTVKGIHL